jgi:hypothetical protein
MSALEFNTGGSTHELKTAQGGGSLSPCNLLKQSKHASSVACKLNYQSKRYATRVKICRYARLFLSLFLLRYTVILGKSLPISVHTCPCLSTSAVETCHYLPTRLSCLCPSGCLSVPASVTASVPAGFVVACHSLCHSLCPRWVCGCLSQLLSPLGLWLLVAA